MPEVNEGKTLCKTCNIVKPIDEFNIMKLNDRTLPVVCYSCEERASKRSRE